MPTPREAMIPAEPVVSGQGTDLLPPWANTCRQEHGTADRCSLADEKPLKVHDFAAEYLRAIDRRIEQEIATDKYQYESCGNARTLVAGFSRLSGGVP